MKSIQAYLLLAGLLLLSPIMAQEEGEVAAPPKADLSKFNLRQSSFPKLNPNIDRDPFWDVDWTPETKVEKRVDYPPISPSSFKVTGVMGELGTDNVSVIINNQIYDLNERFDYEHAGRRLILKVSKITPEMVVVEDAEGGGTPINIPVTRSKETSPDVFAE